MADAVHTTTLPEGPNPTRRTALFYGSAVLAGMAIGGKLFPEVDPVHAAIEAFHKASFALQDCMDDESEEWGRLVDERYAAQVALAKTQPTTREGAHRLMSELVLDELGGDGWQADMPIIIGIASLLKAWPA